ncbi:MAG TPA: D-alanyl-D-alanine carboxypeptidase family protein [Opitutaceae bacterium]|nr:D-alanyl-D-alanine carboxypeptidase family protein [Opitutaceae bacterium]
MIFSRRLLWCALAIASPALFAAAARKAPSRPAPVDNATAYKGAIVIDAATGNVLFEDRADIVTPPASMTKLMTFAVLQDKLNAGEIALNAPVRIVNEDNVGGTQVFLDPRETFPVEELIYAMMVQSANDAARALARFSAGSVQAFVGLMNAKARDLGMSHTTFRSPHGLPPDNRKVADGDLTTPRDFALLSRYLVTRTNVLKYSVVAQRDFAPERKKGPFKMDNHNNLLGKVAGVDGLKTGYTAAAGYCISVTAQRNGRRVIAIVMGSFGPNGQRDLGKTRDMKAIELLEKGFAALPAGPAPATPSAAPANSPFTPAPAKPGPAKAAPPPEPVIKFSIPKK